MGNQLNTQQKMGGKIIIMGFFFLSIFGCQNRVNIDEIGRELVVQNINILIDSVERFDVCKIPMPEGFKGKFRDEKNEVMNICLIDSVSIDINGEINKLNQSKYSKFIIQQNNLVKFKSEYKIKLTKINNGNGKILFVKFSNLKIDNNNATIDVKKNIGISMIKERYFFIRENNLWVFKKKIALGLG